MHCSAGRRWLTKAKEDRDMTAAKAIQDWDNDWYLRIEGAETLRRYSELKEEMSNAPMEEFGIFFAFSNEQFEEGYAELVRNGKLKDGEKVVRTIGGGFAVKGATERLLAYYDGIEAKIKAECDPQEVYWYEYNNHECCIAYDGDLDAIRMVIDIFGRDAAEKVKRMRAFDSIEEIWKGRN